MKWTKEMDNNIKEQVEHMTLSEMMQYYGVSESAMTKKIHRLGISLPNDRDRPVLTEDRVKYLIENYSHRPLVEMRKKMHMSEKTIRKMAKELGLYSMGAVKLVKEAIESAQSNELTDVSEAVEEVMTSRIISDISNVAEDELPDIIDERLARYGICGMSDLRRIILYLEKVAG